MDETQILSALIADIYDAAIQPALRLPILEKTARFVEGCAASLFYKNASAKTGASFYCHGIPQSFQQSYFSQYIKLDPASTSQYFATVDEPLSTVDFIEYDEFVATRFYQEWVEPQGLVDFVTCVLDKSAGGASMLGVFRHQRDGLADAEVRRKMRLLSPHMRRSMLIGRLMDAKTAEIATFADTFDGLHAGMFLVDKSGRIVHANRSGHRLLDARDAVSGSGGRLVATDARSNATLQECFQAAAGGDAAIGLKGIAVPLTGRGGTRMLAHVLPLGSGLRQASTAAKAATAAVFVHNAELEMTAPPEIIARTFSLTPTELRIMLAIVEVGGVPEVASTLGIAESTVKTHLSRLFSKTGAARQADLVKIVAGYSKPLV